MFCLKDFKLPWFKSLYVFPKLLPQSTDLQLQFYACIVEMSVFEEVDLPLKIYIYMMNKTGVYTDWSVKL